MLRLAIYIIMTASAGGAGAYFGGYLAPYGFPSPFLTEEQQAIKPPETQPLALLPDAENKPIATETEPEEVVVEAANSAPFGAYDIVRVAPDGSLVIAGRATPNSIVEVIANDNVIGTLRSDLSGAFALVLDQPLAPGNYVISLNTKTADGQQALSEETAIIQIPEQVSGETLALITQPGQATRVLDASQVQPSVTSKVSDAISAATPIMEPLPESEPVVEPLNSTEDTTIDTVIPTIETEAAQPVGDQLAALMPLEPVATAKPINIDASKVTIEAVEVEGDKLFIAGQAEPGARVRLYAGTRFLGEVQTNGGGRYLLERSAALQPGDYDIRADQLTLSGDVARRAIVPFSRPLDNDFASAAVEVPKLKTVEPQATPNLEVPVTSANVSTELAAEPENVPNIRLEEVASSVIIRRGDTLWQIARRVYGKGVRYSSIYKANEGQIADPDRIWPGQVFAVPDTSEDGEPADMSTIANPNTDLNAENQ